MRTLIRTSLIVAVVVGWSASAQAQTYFPFGSVSVGSSSSGVRVGPFGCVVTTASPTYTTAQIHPCSTTVTGGLRVVLIDPATGEEFAPVSEGPCGDPSRITSVAISESTAATNEIVALASGETIYVCSYKWVTTAANSLRWTRGTGTDCATGLTHLEGAQPFAANGGIVESGGGAVLFSVTAASNALCLTATVATAVGGRLSYVRTATP